MILTAFLPAMLLGLAGPALNPLPAAHKPAEDRMPFTKLAPAKIIPNLCVLRYPISTTSAECQAHFDQGLGYFYSYVWMEAARSFETAARHDPTCPMAWWGLSRALERMGQSQQMEALQKAQALMPTVSLRSMPCPLVTTRSAWRVPDLPKRRRM